MGVRIAVAALLAASVGLAACGSGDGSGDLAARRSPTEEAARAFGEMGGRRPWDDRQGSSGNDSAAPSPATDEPVVGEVPPELPDGAAEDPVCVAAQGVRDLDDRSAAATNDAMSDVITGDLEGAESALEAAVGEISALLPEIDAVYRDLEAAVPEDYRDDVALLRSYTRTMLEKFSAAKGMADIMRIASETNVGETMETAAAVLRLDQLTRERCGIVFSS